jgi:hypothetical protein
MPDPTFMVIGVAKCGTTSLCDLVASHPDVFVTNPKEPHYFSRMTSVERRREWYRSLFEAAPATHIRIGSTTSFRGLRKPSPIAA